MTQLTKLDWGDAIDNVQNNVGNFMGNVAGGVGQFVCGQFQQNPGNFSLTPVIEGFLQSVCPPLGVDLPADPEQPFDGGQCVGVNYFLAFDYINCQGDTVPNGTGSIPGPIVQASITPEVQTGLCGGTGLPRFRHRIILLNDQGQGFNFLDTVSVPEAINKGLVASDGSDINACGSPDPEYPPPNQLPPEINVDIQFDNGEPDGSPNKKDINLPLTYVPVNNEISFPINVDVGGIDINLDVGGLEINIGDENGQINQQPVLSPGEGTQIDNVENITNNTNTEVIACNDKIDAIDTKVDDIKTDTEEIKDKLDSPTIPEDVQPEDADEEPESGEEDEVEVTDPDILYVQVSVSTAPVSGRQHTILQPNPDDSTFFAGYFSWTRSGSPGREPEQPIRKLVNVYHNIGRASGFRIYAVNGAKLKYKLFKKPTT